MWQLHLELLRLVPASSAGEVPARVLAVVAGGAVAGTAGAVAAHPLSLLVSARHAELERVLRMLQLAPLTTVDLARGIAASRLFTGWDSKFFVQGRSTHSSSSCTTALPTYGVLMGSR